MITIMKQWIEFDIHKKRMGRIIICNDAGKKKNNSEHFGDNSEHFSVVIVNVNDL